MRRVAFVSVGRSDYGIYRPILREITARGDVEAGLIVGGEHLVGSRDRPVWREFPVFDSVEMQMAADSASATALSMGVGVSGFARSIARVRPDLMVLLGDRYETFAAAAAAVPFNLPLLHLHGGEITEGAIDERFRHAITKLSHIHCVATELSARRVRQMGEEPWRVHVTGAAGLDVALSTPPLDRSAFFEALSIEDPGPFLLVTYHPVTNEPDPEGAQITSLLDALALAGLPVVCTAANADFGSGAINARLKRRASEPDGFFKFFEGLGPLYSSAMTHASAMVGNSSSGVIEACSYGLPVVNIGNRQKGRERSANILDCDCEAQAIAAAIGQALSEPFTTATQSAVNVYGTGDAGPRIARIAADTEIDRKLLTKAFCGVPGAD